MFKHFVRDFKDTAKDDIRIFFAPYRGAYNAVKEEIARPSAATVPEFTVNVRRFLIAPFVGAFKGVKAEIDRIDERR